MVLGAPVVDLPAVAVAHPEVGDKREQLVVDQADLGVQLNGSGECQVWSLTQFFCILLFVNENDSSSGKHYSLYLRKQLPRLRLKPLKGFLS